MIIVIIAGGSGTRLWPLSQSNYPKHLLRFTGSRSLLQNTVNRASLLTDEIYVITEQSHSAEVIAQLPQIPTQRIIIEPARRGTANCIVLALVHIATQNKQDEPVVFLHADAHITNQEAFSASVRAAAAASAKYRRITLVGVEPSYPATGLGYIQRGSEIAGDKGVYEIAGFKEKPDSPTAKRYMTGGKHLWNMGLFAAPPSVFREDFGEFAPELEEVYGELERGLADSQRFAEVYMGLPSKVIEYELIEKDTRALVVPGAFDWADIGSFFDLHKILQDDDHNSLSGDVEMIDCDDVMIHNTRSKPIVAIGLTGIVVVDSPDGLLVCAKEKAQLVGDVAKKLAQRKSKSKTIARD